MHHRRCWAWIQSQGTFGCLGNRLGSRQTFGFHGVQVEHIAGLLRRENTNERKHELKNSSICISKSQHIKVQPAPCLRRSAAVLVLVGFFISWSSPTRSETAVIHHQKNKGSFLGMKTTTTVDTEDENSTFFWDPQCTW